MHDWLTGLVVALCVVTCVPLVVLLVRDVVAQDRVFALLAVVEAVLLVQVVVGFVSLATTSRQVDGLVFGSYLVGDLLVLPIGAGWSLTERTRSGTGVLLVTVLVVLFMQLRLVTIWNAHV